MNYKLMSLTISIGLLVIGVMNLYNNLLDKVASVFWLFMSGYLFSEFLNTPKPKKKEIKRGGK